MSARRGVDAVVLPPPTACMPLIEPDIRRPCRSRRQTERARALSRAAGFTLLELMFALLVVTVIVSAALPTIQALVSRNELERATESAFETIRFAQVRAAMRGRAYGVFIDVEDTGEQGSIQVVECASNVCCDEATAQSEPDPDTTPTMLSLEFGPDATIGQAYETIFITAVTPASLATNGICMKPDGRVVDADTGLPLESSTEELGYGSISITLQQKFDFGGSPTDVPPSHSIIIDYSGETYFEF